MRAIAGIGKNQERLPLEMKRGETLVGGEDAAQVWKQSFEKLGKIQAVDDVRFDRKFWDQTQQLVEKWNQDRQEGGGELDNIITEEEVKKAIKKIRRGKAAGVDGVVNEILKYAGEEMSRSLWLLFNTMFDEEKIPIDWARGLIVPIFKDGDKHVAENYRGITLLSVVGKLYTVILNSRLSEWCEKNGVLVDEQAGFREARSTTDQIFILKGGSVRKKKQKTDTSCCVLGIKMSLCNDLWS